MSKPPPTPDIDFWTIDSHLHERDLLNQHARDMAEWACDLERLQEIADGSEDHLTKLHHFSAACWMHGHLIGEAVHWTRLVPPGSTMRQEIIAVLERTAPPPLREK